MMRLLYTVVICMVIFGSWFNLALAENVEFSDVNLANKVREALDLPAGADIPKAQLATLTNLDASVPKGRAAKISNLTGLEHAMELTALNLKNNQIRDIGQLAGLTNLSLLSLNDNQIIDLRPLAGLTQLEQLYIEDNQISDLSPLAGLTNLTQLYLTGNPTKDTAALQPLLLKNPNVDLYNQWC